MKDVPLNELDRLYEAARADASLSVKDRHYGVASINWKHALDEHGGALLQIIHAAMEELRLHRRWHVASCPYPEGCDCGASTVNSRIDAVLRLVRGEPTKPDAENGAHVHVAGAGMLFFVPTEAATSEDRRCSCLICHTPRTEDDGRERGEPVEWLVPMRLPVSGGTLWQGLHQRCWDRNVVPLTAPAEDGAVYVDERKQFIADRSKETP